MLQEVFYWTFNMSITAAMTGLLIMLVRLVRKIPRRLTVLKQQSTTLFASAFGGAKIRTRIENILSFKKLTWFSLAVFSALIGIIFYVLLTNAG